MAKNDTVLIDGILDDRVAQRKPSGDRAEAFEYFAFEQILRDVDLSPEEVAFGTVDGRDDGGIDGFFITVNGHPLTDTTAFNWPKSGAELDVWIITCKHHDTFKQAPLDNLVASLAELMDFQKEASDLSGAYSKKVLVARSNLIHAYRALSARLRRFSVHLAYASRGDSASVGDAISARAKQASGIVQKLFGKCETSFEFIGAEELVAMHRHMRTFSLELPFLESLSRGERYLLLCRLQDYSRFATDDTGKPRRYLFDSNVRAFMGLNRVNEDISATLSNEASPDFWWLNNGVTILATAATVVGKSIQLEGVQIVNGLQTTESIARHFSNGGADPRERSVLVKVIVAQDPAIRDAIIRATNNQTAVEPTALHATDKIQRDIDDILFRDGLYYERRTNFYANQGHAANHIVTPMYLAAGYVALVMKDPAAASRFKSKLLRKGGAYDSIFSHETPLKVWPVLARVLKKTDATLETARTLTRSTDRFLKTWRHIVALVTMARAFKSFSFSPTDLISLDLDAVPESAFLESYEFARSSPAYSSDFKVRHARNASITSQICREAGTKWGLLHCECVGRRALVERKQVASRSDRHTLELILSALPTQPWKRGVHREVAHKLGMDEKAVAEAIQLLMARGRVNRQVDGIVYAKDGTVIATDAERVAPGSKESLGR